MGNKTEYYRLVGCSLHFTEDVNMCTAQKIWTALTEYCHDMELRISGSREIIIDALFLPELRRIEGLDISRISDELSDILKQVLCSLSLEPEGTYPIVCSGEGSQLEAFAFKGGRVLSRKITGFPDFYR